MLEERFAKMQLLWAHPFRKFLTKWSKEFETASVLDIEKNKLKLYFSEKESAALNKESYKMSIKLCRETDKTDFIEIFTQNDGFLVIR